MILSRAWVGSSPRVRGKHGPADEAHLGGGLIPACAGKTGPCLPGRRQCWAHPRVCGENSLCLRIRNPPPGSSPRVRGKPIVAPVEHDPPGLIPACAGKTGGRRETLRGEPAHPRVCGENERAREAAGIPRGSSPRVRGKRCPSSRSRRRRRLIPACAGKTDDCGHAAPLPWAHPRVCGENQMGLNEQETQAGSSPRVRGKRRSSHPTGPREGLIPACAGKTSRGPPRPQGPGAHPRVCGENLKIAPTPLLPPGSSPRVRGKPLRQARIQPDGRLIPACAGKTPSPPSSRTRARAHPRVCGENRGFVLSVGFWNGSSPRVRGKRYCGVDGRPGRGLIPACAGKTTGSRRR